MPCVHCAASVPRFVSGTDPERHAHWIDAEGDNPRVEACGENQEPSQAQVLVTAARNRLENALIACDDLASLRAHAREAWMDLRKALGEVPVDTSS